MYERQKPPHPKYGRRTATVAEIRNRLTIANVRRQLTSRDAWGEQRNDANAMMAVAYVARKATA